MDNLNNNNSNECPEEKKKRISLKNKLGQLILSSDDEECLTKNAAAYAKAKRRRKIRKVIIFAIITAVVLATYGFAFLFVYTLPYDHSVANFFRLNILRRGYYFEYRAFRYIPEYINGIRQPDLIRDYYLYPVLYQIEASGNMFIMALIVILTGYNVITALNFFIRLGARGDSKRRKTIISLAASLTKYIGYIVVLIILFEIFNVNQAVLAAIIAALGIAIGFGAQGLVGDLLTGLFLIFEDNLQVGDIITIDGFRGEIEEVGIRTTRLASIGGDVMVINNSRFVKFVNMSMHRSFAVCDLNIEYGENIQKVEGLVLGHLEKAADKFPAITDGPFYKGVAEFNERGVMIRIVAKVSEAERLQLIRDLNREFKLLFDENQIKLAVPKIELVERDERKK